MRCTKCGTDLGQITSGIPVTTNSHVHYEFGRTTVRWTQGGPKECNPLCDACAESGLSPEEKSLRNRCERDFQAGIERQLDGNA
jgi:hypothetical protein